jgi:hypothetical protein
MMRRRANCKVESGESARWLNAGSGGFARAMQDLVQASRRAQFRRSVDFFGTIQKETNYLRRHSDVSFK